MKTIKMLGLGIALFLAGTLNAQVSVNVNIGTPPLWGPVGYSHVNYYYLPDVESYYDINTSLFIYFEGGVWVHRSYLPHRYRNYDLYNGYKVVMNDYHGNSPYDHFRDHKMRYAKGYRGGPQKSIGERPGRGMHRDKMMHQDRPDKDHGRGNGKANHNGDERPGNHDNRKGQKQDKGHGEGNGKRK